MGGKLTYQASATPFMRMLEGKRRVLRRPSLLEGLEKPKMSHMLRKPKRMLGGKKSVSARQSQNDDSTT